MATLPVERVGWKNVWEDFFSKKFAQKNYLEGALPRFRQGLITCLFPAVAFQTGRINRTAVLADYENGADNDGVHPPPE